MTDDIVTRLPDEDLCAGLRMCADLVQGFPKADAKQMTNPNWLRQAADEIERGRKLVEELLVSNNRWQSIAERAMEQLDIAMNLINTLQGANND